MNNGKTIAFDNKGKVWKTRYSFVPTRYAYLDKKMLSCKGYESEEPDSNMPLAWRHDNKASTINNFYGQQYSSKLITSFNKDLSANKIYKSLSLEGTENLKGGASRFLANSTSQPSQLREATVGSLREKGGVLYADLGRGRKSTMSNVEVIGVVRKATPLFTSSTSATKNGYDFDQTLLKLEMDFVSKNFNSSSEFKIVLKSSQGLEEFSPNNEYNNLPTYNEVSPRFTNPPTMNDGNGNQVHGLFKGKDFLIVQDQDMVLEEGGVTTVISTINQIPNENFVSAFDFNGDGEIGSADLLTFILNFGDLTDNFDLTAEDEDGNLVNQDIITMDTDANGEIDSGDFINFLGNYGEAEFIDEITTEEITNTTTEYIGYLNTLNAIIEAAAQAGTLIYAVMVTPNEVNGRDPKGQYADLFLNLGESGTEDFELDILNLNYEHTRLDHSS